MTAVTETISAATVPLAHQRHRAEGSDPVGVRSSRAAERRRATVEEILDRAQAIVAEEGAGAVTVSEIARRMGMRAPSLYKYFPSLQAIYDALFARGNAQLTEYVEDAIRGCRAGS